MKTEVIVYTDGACKGNPGKGGWGCYIKIPNHSVTINWNLCGYKIHTTNNEMELTAIYNALLFITPGVRITFYMDTTYGLKGLVKNSGDTIVIKNGMPIGGWAEGWMKKDWRSSTNQPVKNREMWKDIIKECTRHSTGGSNITLNWIKGHSGIEGNDIADSLANKGVEYLNDLKTHTTGNF